MSFLGPMFSYLLRCGESSSTSTDVTRGVQDIHLTVCVSPVHKQPRQRQQQLCLATATTNITSTSRCVQLQSIATIDNSADSKHAVTTTSSCNYPDNEHGNCENTRMRVQVNSMTEHQSRASTSALMMRGHESLGGNLMYSNMYAPSVNSPMLSSSFDSAASSCRRVASFPQPSPNHHGLMPFNMLASSMKYRSSSESARLHLLAQQQYNPWSQTRDLIMDGTVDVDALKCQLLSVMQQTPPTTPLYDTADKCYSNQYSTPEITVVVAPSLPSTTTTAAGLNNKCSFAQQLSALSGPDALPVLCAQKIDANESTSASAPDSYGPSLPAPESSSSAPSFDRKPDTETSCSLSPPLLHARTTSSTLPRVLAKKKLSFADDHGIDLVQVRYMKESSDTPPKFSSGLLRSIMGDVAFGDIHMMEEKPIATWKVDFAQPASDYVSFRQRFERQNVALENVVLRNERMLGTIRVKNLCFGKQVLLRYTTDSWSTYEDTAAVHTNGNDLFDTFAFDVTLPVDDEFHERIEFAVCFRALDVGRELWDNRDGLNYALVSAAVRERRKVGHSAHWYAHDKTDIKCMARVSEAAELYTDNWSMFSAAKNLSCDAPYW